MARSSFIVRGLYSGSSAMALPKVLSIYIRRKWCSIWIPPPWSMSLGTFPMNDMVDIPSFGTVNIHGCKPLQQVACPIKWFNGQFTTYPGPLLHPCIATFNMQSHRPCSLNYSPSLSKIVFFFNSNFQIILTIQFFYYYYSSIEFWVTKNPIFNKFAAIFLLGKHFSLFFSWFFKCF